MKKICRLFLLTLINVLLAFVHMIVFAAPTINAANNSSIKVVRTNINALNVNVDQKGIKVILGLSKPITYSSFTLTHPYRLAIDIKNARFGVAVNKQAFKNTPITNIRVAERQETNGVRIVLDLSSKMNYQIVQLSPVENNGQRLEISLFNVTPSPKSVPIVVAEKKPAPTNDIRKPTSTKPVAATSNTELRPVATSETVDLPAPGKYASEVASYRDVIVVIDPGHGGKDPGASGVRGTKEKTVVLAIAKKLQLNINQQPGFRAYLTRKGDYFIPLRERLHIARQYKADMFVAIHADAFSNNDAQGASVYALSERGATSEAAFWLANSENRSESLGEVSLGKKDEMLRSVLIDLAQTSTITTSLHIGNAILRQLGVFSRLHYHKVEQAAFVVLKSPDIPSLLVESGFLSNSKEEYRLNDPVYQQKIAFAIMQGIKSYFINNPLRGTIFSAKKANIVKHLVGRGETVSKLAGRYKVEESKLRKMNHLSGNKLEVGQTLVVPVKS